MKFIPSAIFLLISNFLFAQTVITATKEEMDSLMCPKGHAAIGQPYQEFNISSKKRSLNNQSIQGKVVFINFWFEGCHPCIAEMEALNEVYNKLKDKKDFVFISLTRDDEETIKRVKKKFKLDFDVFSASSEECVRLNFGCGYPTSLIIDKAGVVRYKHCGGAIDKDQAREFVMATMLPQIESLLQ